MMLDWSRTRVHLNNGGRVRCEPTWQWEARTLDYDLWLVWAGRGVAHGPEGDIPLRPGVCLWLRPQVVLRASQDPDQRLGVSFRHFELRDTRGRLRPYTRPIPPLVHDILDIEYADGVMRRINELEEAGRDPDALAGRVEDPAAALLKGLLMDLDDQAGRAPAALEDATRRHHRQVALRAAARLRESPSDAPPVEALAAEHGYSVDHFSRVFRQEVGLSPQQYLVRARIDRARELLRETTLSVAAIAAALGYTDVFFFSKQFKQKTGATPSAYRRMAGQSPP